MTGKFTSTPNFSLMFCTQPMWAKTESIERPMSTVFRSAKALSRPAKARNSVVQTGVKSAGWEKRTTHFSLFHSESLRRPCVVLASKSGAGPPSWMRGASMGVRLMFFAPVGWEPALAVSLGLGMILDQINKQSCANRFIKTHKTSYECRRADPARILSSQLRSSDNPLMPEGCCPCSRHQREVP